MNAYLDDDDTVKPLRIDKIFGLIKWKAFADDKLDVVKMTISLFDGIENTVEKCLRAFSPFLTLFSKAIFFRFMW